MRKSVVAMMSLPLFLLATAMGAEAPATAPATQPVIRPSEAVREGGLDFQVVTADLWPEPKPGKATTVDVTLKVTNKSDSAIQLNLMDTIRMNLKDAAGKDVSMEGARNGTRPLPPVHINKGEAIKLRQSVILVANQKPGSYELSYHDETGTVWRSGELKIGKYTLSITHENRIEKPAGVITEGAKKVGQFWVGKVTTKELAIEITDKPLGPAVEAPDEKLAKATAGAKAAAEKSLSAQAAAGVALKDAPQVVEAADGWMFTWQGKAEAGAYIVTVRVNQKGEATVLQSKLGAARD